MTEYLPQLALAWSIQFMGVISPGPGIMLILGVAMSQGRLASMITAFGRYRLRVDHPVFCHGSWLGRHTG
ncbi:hypothetical protein ACSQ76_21965 [Roseovarius sp. B08]|uniref:hypothetical protein n=1 Tax=Roseovarius sp. B08 TaxID=3449223 RepID=UPI003EDBB545